MTYRPLLRWKRGEQTALANLDEAHKREVQPLLVIKGHSYDPPQGQSNDPAFDTRIVQDADRLRGAWAGHRVAIDFGNVDPDAECSGGEPPIARFFAVLNGEVEATPVLRPSSDGRLVQTVARLNLVPTFRLTPDDLAASDIEATLRGQMESCNVQPRDCDIVVDLGYIATAGRSLITARGGLQALPFLQEWSSVTLASGSFPENLSEYLVGAHLVERIEWNVWLAVKEGVGRQVNYGDYTTIHPNPVEEGLDPRTMNPSASVRYTHEGNWLLLRGEGTRNRGGRGFAQFQDHANRLILCPEYRGQHFSAGDERIARIARGDDGAGNLETWVTIGVNHHIAEIAGQLASLP